MFIKKDNYILYIYIKVFFLRFIERKVYKCGINLNSDEFKNLFIFKWGIYSCSVIIVGFDLKEFIVIWKCCNYKVRCKYYNLLKFDRIGLDEYEMWINDLGYYFIKLD